MFLTFRTGGATVFWGGGGVVEEEDMGMRNAMVLLSVIRSMKGLLLHVRCSHDRRVQRERMSFIYSFAT